MATGTEYAPAELFSQASVRSYRYFTDQHGREWGADTEDKTKHPCGPIAPFGWDAPLVVPQKYIGIKDTARGLIEIRYDDWIKDEQTAHEEWLLFALEQATNMYGDKGAQALEDRDVALMRRCGLPPLPVERILAAKAGNRWVLGLKNPKTGLAEPKPRWAEQYFPERVKPGSMDDLRAAFPNAEDEAGGAAVQQIEDEPTEYPHMFRPGMWWLSSTHRAAVIAGEEEPYKGNKKDATMAAELRGDGSHETWR